MADVAEDGGHVEGSEGEGFGPNAPPNTVGDGVRGDGVVVLEDSAVFGDGPREGTEACTDRVGVGVAVDAPPRVFGSVVGGVVGGARDDAEAGVGVAVLGELSREDVVAVVLADDFGAKSHRRTMNEAPGTLVRTHVAWSSSWEVRVGESFRGDRYVRANPVCSSAKRRL